MKNSDKIKFTFYLIFLILFIYAIHQLKEINDNLGYLDCSDKIDNISDDIDAIKDKLNA